MELLEPGFAVAETTGVTIGRLRPPADPLIDAAVDRALREAEWPVLELDVPEWDRATGDAGLLLVVEAWESNRALVARDPEGIGTYVRERLALGGVVRRGRDRRRLGRAAGLDSRRWRRCSSRSTSWSRPR